MTTCFLWFQKCSSFNGFFAFKNESRNYCLLYLYQYYYRQLVIGYLSLHFQYRAIGFVDLTALLNVFKFLNGTRGALGFQHAMPIFEDCLSSTLLTCFKYVLLLFKYVKFLSLSSGISPFTISRLCLLQAVNNFLPEVFTLSSQEDLSLVCKVLASMPGSKWLSWLPSSSCRSALFPVLAVAQWWNGKRFASYVNVFTRKC